MSMTSVRTNDPEVWPIWLHSQRMKHRRGGLDASKTAALDEAVPGWRVGRKRGRPVAASSKVRASGSDVENLSE